MRLALVARRSSETNARLAAVRHGPRRWDCLTPAQALEQLAPGDVALGRLDVLPTLDGVDEGLWALGELAARGVHVLNPPSALLAAHDKLLTARLLHGAGLPHPHTRLVTPRATPPAIDGPVVVKPRFGSWGRGVAACADAGELGRLLRSLAREPWFARHGALVQELVPPQGYDLRVLVAGGVVAGAIRRVARPGEWRTNVSLGARREPVTPSPEECRLALATAGAAGIDLAGVDLLPDGCGGWTVVELNGAVDFTDDYATGRDVFADVAFELSRAGNGAAGLLLDSASARRRSSVG